MLVLLMVALVESKPSPDSSEERYGGKNISHWAFRDSLIETFYSNWNEDGEVPENVMEEEVPENEIMGAIGEEEALAEASEVVRILLNSRSN